MLKTSYENIKFKTYVPTRNDKFELPDGSFSVYKTQDYFEYIIENIKQ